MQVHCTEQRAGVARIAETWTLTASVAGNIWACLNMVHGKYNQHGRIALLTEECTVRTKHKF